MRFWSLIEHTILNAVYPIQFLTKISVLAPWYSDGNTFCSAYLLCSCTKESQGISGGLGHEMIRKEKGTRLKQDACQAQTRSFA